MRTSRDEVTAAWLKNSIASADLDASGNFHRIPPLDGSVLHRCRAFQFVPRKRLALDGTLHGSKQNDGENLAIGEALQPHLAEQPGIFAGFGLARSRAKAIDEAMKSITRNTPKKIIERWKLAGSVVSG